MNHFKRFWAFYVPYILFVIALATLILVHEKAEFHLRLTSFHTSFSDTFFIFYTHFGGIFPFIIAALLLFYKYKASLLILVAEAASSLITHTAKLIFEMPRPMIYFRENFPDASLYQIEGYNHISPTYSFPSGHTTAAFAFFLSLAFLSNNKILQFTYFILAALVGYSRVYLSQHFAVDVLWGSIIAVITTALCYVFIFDRYPMTWADGSLRDIFTRKNS